MLGFSFFADQSDASRTPVPRPDLPTPKPKPNPNPDDSKLKAQTDGPPADELDEDEEDVASVKDEAGEALALIVPWMTSFLVHLGIAILALFVAWAVISVPEEDPPIVPVARLSANPGGQLSESQEVQLQQTQNVRQVESQSVSTSETVESLDNELDESLDLIGASGGGGGGKLAPFGSTSGSAQGLGAQFYGTGGGNARKIVYCVDASGSLIAGMPFVIKELKKSIGELSDKQEFTVIFFQDGEPIEPAPRGWKVANSENKRAVMDWMSHQSGNLIAGGKTDPQKAIRIAMNYKPELLFILSDNITGLGKYEIDRADLLKFLSDSNRPDSRGELRTKINTIQFLHPDSLNTLEDIAKQHGGIYKFVTHQDLGLSSK